MQLTLPYPSFTVRELGGYLIREATLEVDAKPLVDKPESAVAYWRDIVVHSQRFDAAVENLVVLHLNARKRVISHRVIGQGTLDTILVHPREIFRTAILDSASAIILVHNHPSGESDPSEADIKITRDLIRAGQLLKIELVDHIVVGNPKFHSLRELGYFYTS